MSERTMRTETDEAFGQEPGHPLPVGLKELAPQTGQGVIEKVIGNIDEIKELAAFKTEIEKLKLELADARNHADELLDELKLIRDTGGLVIEHLDANCAQATIHHHLRGWEFPTAIPEGQRENLAKLKVLLAKPKV